jgi:transposase-like protein
LPQRAFLAAGPRPPGRHRTPVYDYRCRRWGKVFNIFTGTLFQKSCYRPSVRLQILRGIGQGVLTKHLADELHSDRGTLLARRHAVQALLEQCFPPQGYPPGN